MINLSEHFTLEEMVRSQTTIRLGIDNTPPPFAIENLRALSANVLEILRAKVGKPLHIDSGFRCEELNEKIGGASKVVDGVKKQTSQHCEGKAADVTVAGMSVDEVVEAAKALPVFDQLIHEFGEWTHISFQSHLPNRREVLRAIRDENGKTKYIPYEAAV